jgi:hypothetical protein
MLLSYFSSLIVSGGNTTLQSEKNKKFSCSALTPQDDNADISKLSQYFHFTILTKHVKPHQV